MSERKRCSWVHDTMFIQDNGDVFACCHNLPAVVGNLYTDTLRTIYNGDKIKEFRRQEIEGTLACTKNCNLPQAKIDFDTVERDYDKDVKRLQILFGERCNIKCIMCPQDHGSKVEIDDEIIVKNVEIPQSRPTVIFQGGETLILKSAKRFFDKLSGRGAKIMIMTNGTALSEEMAKKIALNATAISFSLNAASKEIHEIVNAGSKFEKVIRNINRVIAAKRELKGKVSITGHMTIVRENIHEIPDFIRKKEEFGFERINFGFDRLVPRELNKDPAKKAELSNAVEMELARAVSVKHIDVRRLQMLGLVSKQTAVAAKSVGEDMMAF